MRVGAASYSRPAGLSRAARLLSVSEAERKGAGGRSTANCEELLDAASGLGRRALEALVAVRFPKPLLLRRVASNILALTRSVTLRGEAQRARPFADLMRSLYNVLIAATDHTVANLRPRVNACC